MPVSTETNVVQVENLSIHFGSSVQPVRAVEGVSFHIGRGEAVGLVGESGCGKSLTALALGRLVPEPAGRYAGGSIRLDGADVLGLPEHQLRKLRGGRIAYVFQEPSSALNPVHSIGWQIREVLRLHRPAPDVEADVDRLLLQVGLPEPDRVQRAFPHQLSGGMQQRAMIAMALAGQPDVLVADEPTTALDVTVQAQVMDLLIRLQHELGMAFLLITHNLGLVARSTRRIYVMYAGQIVEQGPTLEVLRAPAHPYTRALLRAVPRLRGGQGQLEGIAGSVPHGGSLPAGCRFHPRCPRQQARCSVDAPVLEKVEAGHDVRCHFWR